MSYLHCLHNPLDSINNPQDRHSSFTRKSVSAQSAYFHVATLRYHVQGYRRRWAEVQPLRPSPPKGVASLRPLGSSPNILDNSLLLNPTSATQTQPFLFHSKRRHGGRRSRHRTAYRRPAVGTAAVHSRHRSGAQRCHSSITTVSMECPGMLCLDISFP